MEPVKYKVCSQCGVSKPLSDYHKNKGARLGVKAACKACTNARRRSKRQESPHVYRERNRRYRERNRGKVRDNYLRKNFGIGLSDYNEMLKEQAGKCAVCLTPEVELPQALSVDHCHATGQVRGLLCKSCNLALGNLRDSRDAIIRALVYLGYVSPPLR